MPSLFLINSSQPDKSFDDLSIEIVLLNKQPKFPSYPLWDATDLIWFLSWKKSNSEILKVFFIELPKTLLTILLLSNFVTEVSFRVKVDWAEVKRLNSSAFAEIFEPKPQLVIIFLPSKKYSKDKGPDWYLLEKSLFGGLPTSKKIELFLNFIIWIPPTMFFFSFDLRFRSSINLLNWSKFSSVPPLKRGTWL